MASELVRQLVESGIHFGHRASRWNPKMAPFIYGKRSTIHIIDVRETVKGLLRAKKFITQVVASGKDVLFVGTKRQAKQLVEMEANKAGMHYVSERWLGGTLTNFKTIRSRLSRLDELEAADADGTALEYSKKMIATRTRELRKIRRNLQGIRNMDRLPGVLFVIDVRREANAVHEARNLGIPTICLIDTDSDPDFADLPIPGNDDAIRSIELVLRHIGEAVEEGKRSRSAAPNKDDKAPRAQAKRAERAPAGEVASAAASTVGGGAAATVVTPEAPTAVNPEGQSS